MSVKTDVVNLVITVNGNEAKKNFYELKGEAAKLRQEMQGLKKGTDEWIKKSDELKAVEQKISQVRKEIDVTSLSVKDLRQEIARMKSVRDALDPASKEFQELSAKIKQAELRMRDLSQGGSFLGNTFNLIKTQILSLGAVLLGGMGIGAFIQFGKDALSAFREAETGVNLLRNAVMNMRGESEEAFDTLIEQSERLSAANGGSIFGDDDIINAQKFFAVFGMGSEQIKEVIPVIIEFATQNGLKLEEASELFIKGVNGMGRGLKEYGITIKDAGDKNVNFTNTLEQFEAKSKGAFDSLAEGEKTLVSLSDAWGEFKEIVGSRILPMISGGLTSAFQGLYGWIKKVTEVPLSEKLEEERMRLMEIDIQLKQTNLSQEDRNKLIDELQAKYPSYFKNLDKEKVSNEDLSAAIALVNEELINKIVLQQKEEEIQAKVQQTAEQRAFKLKTEKEALGSLAEAADRYNIEIGKGKNLIDQLQQAHDAIIEKNPFGNKSSEELKYYIGLLTTLEEGQKKAAATLLNLQEEKTKLAKDLGVDVGGTGSGSGQTTDLNTTTNTEVDTKNLDKAASDLKALNEKIQQMRREMELSGLSANQRELEAIYDKYQKEIEAAKGNTAQIKQLNDLMVEEYKMALQRQEDARKLQGEKVIQSIEEQLQQEAEKQYEAILTAQQVEEKAAMEKFDKLKLLAYEALQSRLIDEQQYADALVGIDEAMIGQLLMIDQKYQDERRAIIEAAQQGTWDKLGTGTAPDTELSGSNFQELQTQYDQRLEMLRQFYAQQESIVLEAHANQLSSEQDLADNLRQITQQKNSSIEQLDKSLAQKRGDIALQLSLNLIQNAIQTFSILLDRGKEYTAGQKIAAILQIGADTAKAISSLTAASEGNPMNAAGFGIPGVLQFAAGIVRIFANMGLAKKQLSQPTAQKRKGGYTRKVRGADDGRTYEAKLLPGFEHGYINDDSLVLAGEDGKREYFVSNNALQVPAVQRAVEAIEALTRGNISEPDFQAMLALPGLQQRDSGGYVGEVGGSSAGSSGSTSDFVAALAMAMNRLNDHLDKGIKAKTVIGDRDLEDFNERNAYIQSLRDQAN